MSIAGRVRFTMSLRTSGMVKMFCERSIDDCATVDGFRSTNDHHELTWNGVAKALATQPAHLERGEIVRLNELGYAALNQALWEWDVKRIGLAFAVDDHRFVRPILDQILGARSHLWDSNRVA